MGNTTNFGWNYGARGQSPWWDEWVALWNAVDTELYTRSKDLYMGTHSIYGVDELVVSGHSAFGNDAGIDKDYPEYGLTMNTIFDVRETFTTINRDFVTGGYINVTLDQDAPITGPAITGLACDIFTTAGNSQNMTSGYIAPIYTTVWHKGSGTIKYIWSFDNLIMNSGGAIENAYGVGGNIGNLSASTMTNVYGGYYLIYNEGAGEITNAYGIYSEIWKDSGTILNGYGIYLGDTSGYATNAWNIYSAGANSRNQFEGKIMLDSYLEIKEMSAPSGIGDKAIIFAKDNGAGKTQLMVIFPTGVAQQLAIEA